ncbi:hypothetical protein [Acetobacter orientalis]|uniref:hypothetical protein n=1 Tax=Acetobacter orientalis TaxID=146474 RepID=UPI0039EBA406
MSHLLEQLRFWAEGGTTVGTKAEAGQPGQAAHASSMSNQTYGSTTLIWRMPPRIT